jgi:V/A-type H+-transporting ATPase subunit K
MEENRKRLRKQIFMSVAVLVSVLAIFGVITGARLFAQETGVAQTAAASSVMTPEQATVSKFAFIAAAVAFGLGALGAGLAIGNVGAAAMGAVAEKPEVAGQALIFVALAEGLVIFGFITALMIIGKV